VLIIYGTTYAYTSSVLDSHSASIPDDGCRDGVRNVVIFYKITQLIVLEEFTLHLVAAKA